VSDFSFAINQVNVSNIEALGNYILFYMKVFIKEFAKANRKENEWNS
jgi:hypothetical protein